MNDDELITAVRESFNEIRSATAVERIVSRSRAVRARRRVSGVAAALGAAAAAVAVSVALPASHPASGPGTRLAAWTVTRQAAGSIQVTFREMRDAAGLQRVLRADGVPASVTFPGPENPACRNLPSPHWRLGQPGGPLDGVVSLGPHNGRSTPYALVIHPAALPPDAGLTLFYPTPAQIHTFNRYHYYPGPPMSPSVGLVQASPRCTGS